ncbi:MAG: YggT family protein [Rhabdochlamydiaceae bacterium]|nr:YggT family protein [Rhabdochlamydiaceae bacterium]
MIAARVIQYVFFVYITMIAVRIIASWFPSIQRYQLYYWLTRCTDPYLNLFRRLVPPIGGVLDLSPMLAYFSLQFFEWLILKSIL